MATLDIDYPKGNYCYPNFPVVSIITTLYNLGQYLGNAVKSVVLQTYTNWEMIIVDDCSTDNSYQIALDLQDKYSDYSIYVLQNPQNLGLSATLNVGISNAKCRYFIALDADDMIAPDYLQRTMSVMMQGNADIVYTNLQCFGERNGIVQNPDFNPVLMLFFNYIPVCSLVKKDVWEAVGGYDGEVPEAPDYHFWLKAIENGFVGKHIPLPLFQYRIRSGSMYHTEVLESLSKNNIMKAKIINNHRALFEPEQLAWADKVLANDPYCLHQEIPKGLLPFFVPFKEMHATLQRRFYRVIEENRQKQAR